MNERIYPRWIHHPEKGGAIVNSAEHEAAHRAAHGEGWVDSPSDFPPKDAPPPDDPKPRGKPGPKPRG